MRRRILITGATSGIGLALATRLAPRHDILATGRVAERDVAGKLPPNVHFVQASQKDPIAAARSIAARLDELGYMGLDNAILNAGTGFVAEPQQETAEKTRETLDVNLAATIAISHTIYPYLAKRGGRLTIIGSKAARGSPRIASYAASKAGLAGLVRALRMEWRGRVSVQILHPGPTATGMHEKAGYEAGRLGAFFLTPTAMAAMLEYAISRGRSPLTLWWARYIAGESVFGRRL